MSSQSPTALPSKKAFLLSQLDVEIITQESHLIHLRRDRNSRLPVNEMPPEVLSRIFLEVKNQLGATWESADALPIIHVCCYWREVAWECTPLWCHIDQTATQWLDLCLDRSKNADLSVNIEYPVQQSFVAEALNKELHRMRSLRLRFNVGSSPENWESPLPRLESLWLDSFFLDRSLFSVKVAPQLRSLILSDSHIRLSTLEQFSMLTSLVLTGARIERTPLVRLLSCVPQLERLLLGRLHVMIKEPSLTTCHLPSLSLISIGWIVDSTLEDFLTGITFPENVTIWIGLSLHQPDLTIEGFKILSRHYFQGLDCLTISQEPDFRWLCLDYSSTSGRHVVLNTVDGLNSTVTMGRKVLPILSPGSITRLDLAYSGETYELDILFEPFPNVEVLRLCDIHFTRSLGVKLGYRDSRGPLSYNLAPKLRKLILGDRFDPQTLSPDMHSLLQETVNARVEIGLTDVILEKDNTQVSARFHHGDHGEHLSWAPVDLEPYKQDLSFVLPSDLEEWHDFARSDAHKHPNWLFDAVWSRYPR